MKKILIMVGILSTIMFSKCDLMVPYDIRGCGEVGRKIDVPLFEKPEFFDIEFDMPDVIKRNEPLVIKVRVTYTGENPVWAVTKMHERGHKKPFIQFYITTNDTTFIWSYRCGPFLLAEEVIGQLWPGQSYTYEIKWNQRDREGRRVDVGEYMVFFRLHLTIYTSFDMREEIYSSGYIGIEPRTLRIVQ